MTLPGSPSTSLSSYPGLSYPLLFDEGVAAFGFEAFAGPEKMHPLINFLEREHHVARQEGPVHCPAPQLLQLHLLF